MKNFKNYLIALLTALLAVSLLTQPAQSAGKSKEAKTVEYAQCLKNYSESIPSKLILLDSFIKECARYQP